MWRVFFFLSLPPPPCLPQAHTSPSPLLLVKITLQKLMHWVRVCTWAPLACFQETLSAVTPDQRGLQVLWEKPRARRGPGATNRGCPGCAPPAAGHGDRAAELSTEPPVVYVRPRRIWFFLPAIQFIVSKSLSLLDSSLDCALVDCLFQWCMWAESITHRL